LGISTGKLKNTDYLVIGLCWIKLPMSLLTRFRFRFKYMLCRRELNRAMALALANTRTASIRMLIMPIN